MQANKLKPNISGLVAWVEVNGLGQLATDCDVTYQAVQKWIRKKRVPAERARDIERATQGRVTRYQLRPDVFGSTAPTVTDAREAG